MIVSEGFSLDQATSRLSAFHLFDKIAVNSYPFLVPSITVMALFDQEEIDRTDSVDCNMKIEINGKTLFEQAQNVMFTPPAKMNRFISQIQGLLITEVGRLHFSITKDSQKLAYWDVEVVHTGQPTMKPSQQATSSKTRGAEGLPANAASRTKTRARSKPSK